MQLEVLQPRDRGAARRRHHDDDRLGRRHDRQGLRHDAPADRRRDPASLGGRVTGRGAHGRRVGPAVPQPRQPRRLLHRRRPDRDEGPDVRERFDVLGDDSGNVYATPVYVENGPGGKGTFYVATEDANVFAIDETTGSVTWQKNVGKAANQTGAGCGNIGPIGITGTPAVDLATRLLVFDAASADGNGNIATHTIYGMSIDDGPIKWQVDVSKLTDGMGLSFSPQPQNERSAVLILNGVAYVPFGGHYGDCGSYHGWVVGVPLSGTGATAWATQVGGAGIWGVGGAASDGTSIFVTTGNGFDSSMTWAGSEGLFRLTPGLTFSGSTMDYFVPYNWYSLDQGDVDFERLRAARD